MGKKQKVIERYIQTLMNNDNVNFLMKIFQASWICDEFEKSEYGKSIATIIEESCSSTLNAEILHPAFTDSLMPTLEFKKVHCLTQLEWLTWRIYIDYKRNVSALLLRFLLYMVS